MNHNRYGQDKRLLNFPIHSCHLGQIWKSHRPVLLSCGHIGRPICRQSDSSIARQRRSNPVPSSSQREQLLYHPAHSGTLRRMLFALGSHIPKTIWRRKLPLLKFFIEGWLRKSATMMLSWEIGIRTGWEKSLGSKGKHLESLLTPNVWNESKRTYVDSDYDNLWDSLFLFHSIFKRSAELVAEKCSFRFPRETADRVLGFLEHVRTLPTDSERIY